MNLEMKTKHGTEEEYSEHAGLLMKSGRWSLWDEKGSSSLWHQCSKQKEPVYGNKEPSYIVYPIKYLRYSLKTKACIKPRWGCGTCGAKPPDSILTVYQLHNFDEMKEEVTQHDPRGPGGWIIK